MRLSSKSFLRKTVHIVIVMLLYVAASSLVIETIHLPSTLTYTTVVHTTQTVIYTRSTTVIYKEESRGYYGTFHIATTITSPYVWTETIWYTTDISSEHTEMSTEILPTYTSKEETKPEPTDHDRELALKVLKEKLTLWLPPESDLEGDEIRSIYYRVHRYPDGYTYITYIVDWNRQRGEYLGHDFDYEPIVVALDETNNVRQVNYDAGHYAKGRVSVDTNAGPIDFIIDKWSHCYNYVDKVSEKGYSALDTDKLTKEEGILGLDRIEFSEWTEESMKEMNTKLEEVISVFPIMGPSRLSLLPLYNDPCDHCRDIVFGYGNPFYDYGGQMHLSQDATLPIDELPEGTPITTGPNSLATVKGDVSTIDIAPESIFIFEDDKSSKLCFGKVHIESKAELNIETLNSLIQSKETEFEITADLGKTKVLVYEGSVEVSDRNKVKTIIVNAGEISTVETDGAPSQPTSFNQETTEKWWEKKTTSGTTSIEALLASIVFIAFLIAAIRKTVSKRKNAISVTTHAQPPKESAFCEECGRRIPPGSTFCPHCGDKQGVA